MPLFSIITPTYNNFGIFGRCAKSLLNQDFRDFEWIIVDDGSTPTYHDKLKKICKTDARISLVRIDKNRGVSHARYEALKHCTGKYVSFLDSDDVLVPDSLGRIAEYMRNNAADVYVTDSYFSLPLLPFRHKNCQSADYPISHQSVCTGVDAALAMLSVNGVTSALWDKIIKRELLGNHTGVAPNVKLGEDLMMLVRVLAHAGTVKFVNVYSYVWRLTGGGYKYYLQNWHEYDEMMTCLYEEINGGFGYDKPLIDKFIKSMVDNYLYQLRESCARRILKRHSNAAIIKFVEHASRHILFEHDRTRQPKPQSVLPRAYEHLRRHRKSYFLERVSLILNSL